MPACEDAIEFGNLPCMSKQRDSADYEYRARIAGAHKREAIRTFMLCDTCKHAGMSVYSKSVDECKSRLHACMQGCY